MNRRREFVGTVTSNKMQKTIIVQVVQRRKHPKYARLIKRSVKFKVHDEKNSAKIGDTVRIQETRPLSKDKRFCLVEIVKKLEGADIELKGEI